MSSVCAGISLPHWRPEYNGVGAKISWPAQLKKYCDLCIPRDEVSWHSFFPLEFSFAKPLTANENGLRLQ
jgi:hypothetical protein